MFALLLACLHVISFFYIFFLNTLVFHTKYYIFFKWLKKAMYFTLYWTKVKKTLPPPWFDIQKCFAPPLTNIKKFFAPPLIGHMPVPLPVHPPLVPGNNLRLNYLPKNTIAIAPEKKIQNTGLSSQLLLNSIYSRIPFLEKQGAR